MEHMSRGVKRKVLSKCAVYYRKRAVGADYFIINWEKVIIKSNNTLFFR